MFCATLSLVEKLSGEIRHKHVSKLHVIIVPKLPQGSMNHPLQLVGAAGENTPAILTFISALGEGKSRQAHVREPDLLVHCWII